MPRLSHSQLQTYKQCQLKYRFQYIDKLETTFDKTVHTLLGTAVHSALEFLYKQISNHVTPTLEQVQHVMTDEWHREKAALIEPATAEIEEQFLHRWIAYLEWYYKTYAPFTQARPRWFEQRIAYKLDDDTTISGIIDRLDASGDTLYINDYKTNQRVNPDDHDSHEEQLTIYGLAAQQTYGKKFPNIIGRLIYLHLEKEYVIELTQARMDALRQDITTIIAEIKHKAAQYNGWLGDRDAFVFTTWDHCKYCPFETVCPAWKHKYGTDEVVMTDLWESTIKRMIDEYGMLQKKIRELEKEEKSLAAVLTEFVKEREETRFFGNDYVLSTRKFEKAVIADPLMALRRMKELEVLSQYAKPNDSVLLKAIKTGELPPALREFVDIESKKILMWTKSRTKTGDEEDEEE
jgi:putative RecB family exonuclease